MSFLSKQALEDLSLQYDSTVRNSENTVVQFTYGDDGLHPDKMENNDRPVDFQRLRMHIQQTDPCSDENALLGSQMMKLVEDKLASREFQAILPTGQVFMQEVRDYFLDLAAQQSKYLTESGSDKDFDSQTWYTSRMTTTQVNLLLQRALEKLLQSFVEPGEAVGAIGAQSISEPGTQMTLKVRCLHLHHACVKIDFC
jgi:DNA-directed RNA polymerase III subunit RPC1